MVKPLKHLFTIGYQGKDLPEFLGCLKTHAVNIVADIRANPYSRNRDYSQKNLMQALNNEGIQYLHFKTLGSPAELRREVAETGDYEHFFHENDKHLAGQTTTLNLLSNLVIDNTICLLCMEADHNICHRRAVADKLVSITGFPQELIIIHL